VLLCLVEQKRTEIVQAQIEDDSEDEMTKVW